MIDPSKLSTLIERLVCMSHLLSSKSDLTIQKRIDQFHYLEKIEEMKLIHTLLEESQARLETVSRLACERYGEVFKIWRKDIRWLTTYLRNRKDSGTIL